MIQLGARNAFHLMDGRPREFWPIFRYGVQFEQCVEVDVPCEPERGEEVGFTQPRSNCKAGFNSSMKNVLEGSHLAKLKWENPFPMSIITSDRLH